MANFNYLHDNICIQYKIFITVSSDIYLNQFWCSLHKLSLYGVIQGQFSPGL